MGKLREGVAERLTLYARHLGWLHATPQMKGNSERQSAPVSRQLSLSNKAKLGKEVEGLDLPTVGGLGYLIEHWLEVGPAQGGEALTFREIEAWSSLTGVQLNAWEASMLRRLSNAYLGEYHDAKDPQRKPPYLPSAEDDES